MITGTPEEQPATRKRITNRLKRAQGQLNAVIASVEAGDTCRDIVTQLSAVTSALDLAQNHPHATLVSVTGLMVNGIWEKRDLETCNVAI